MRAAASLAIAILSILLVPFFVGAQASPLTVRDHTMSIHVATDGALTLLERLEIENVAGPSVGEIRMAVPTGLTLVQAIVDGRAALWRTEGEGVVAVQLAEPAPAGGRFVVELQESQPPFPGPRTVAKALLHPTDALLVRVHGAANARVGVGGNEVPGAELREVAITNVAAGETISISIRPTSSGAPVVWVVATALLFVLVAAVGFALRQRTRDPPREMGVLAHLGELTLRLRVSLLAVLVLTFFCFTFAVAAIEIGGFTIYYPQPSFTDNLAAQTFREIVGQVLPAGVEVIVTSPADAALVQIEVALFLALVIASPIVGYHLGGFLGPALQAREKRFLLRSIPAVSGLFVGGAAFALFLLVPTMLRILYLYASGIGARAFVSVESLVGFTVLVAIAFGLAFQLPVFMYALSRLGLVASRSMVHYWRHTVVGLFILAAVITPDPSLVSQLLVAIPLCALYGMGLLAARAAERNSAPAGSVHRSVA